MNLSLLYIQSENFMDTVLRVRVGDIQFAVDEMEIMNSGERKSISLFPQVKNPVFSNYRFATP